MYRQRKAIVEHPFGTMKRQWGFDHILSTQGKKRASADVGFIFIAYNLKRILNLFCKKARDILLKTIHSYFTTWLRSHKSILRTKKHFDLAEYILAIILKPSVKNLILVHNWQKLRGS
ncbi:transposase [Autumnicola musiva]|uniref:Transposase n=1 Tax=Autumnicola musiva TaxID=3075589 RepID=A0ABU3D514_9FLAO|nr:transposase [Zunongwangia sp. F117]MDT0676474.1 transposase [Zunongwangia sp. F117]